MLSNITSLIQKYDAKMWVMINDDESDKIFTRYFSGDLFSRTICFVTKTNIYLIVCSLDADNLYSGIFSNIEQSRKIVKYYVYNNAQEMDRYIEEIIAQNKFPKEISLSYSTMSDNNTDILTHGAYIYLTSLLKKPYKKYEKKVKFVSAENIIYELASKKTESQVERLRILANITDEILKESFKKIKVGDTEREISLLTNNIMNDKMRKIISRKLYNIVDFDVAWDNCPIVLTGENLAKGGHSLPSDKKLKCGDTIYFDFGIKAVFEDGESLYTDMQRMGYALKDGESMPPKSVMKVFKTLVDAIEEGIENCKPGVLAYKIDDIVRGKILSSGYINYNHATGHPVGLAVHDIGAVISTRSSKRARLPLIENGIYTLEPRINIPNGGSIEEMILVTKYGGKPLTAPQKDIYLV